MAAIKRSKADFSALGWLKGDPREPAPQVSTLLGLVPFGDVTAERVSEGPEGKGIGVKFLETEQGQTAHHDEMQRRARVAVAAADAAAATASAAPAGAAAGKGPSK